MSIMSMPYTENGKNNFDKIFKKDKCIKCKNTLPCVPDYATQELNNEKTEMIITKCSSFIKKE